MISRLRKAKGGEWGEEQNKGTGIFRVDFLDWVREGEFAKGNRISSANFEDAL